MFFDPAEPLQTAGSADASDPQGGELSRWRDPVFSHTTHMFCFFCLKFL